MARKSSISIDYSAFSDLAEQLDELGADLKKIFDEALEEAAEKVQEDTKQAMESANLPAGGKYSQGDTVASIVPNPKVEWQGTMAEIGLGFDKTKQGAGGFLITGTPKMQPNKALERIYGRKTYEKEINKMIEQKLQRELDSRLGR